MKTVINACIIVKDDSEINSLQRAISSIEPFVEGIYITTTGKVDTQIEKLCLSNGYYYSHLDWCDDFSKVRNYNFSQVPKDTDYILWIDSDDYFVGGPKLQEVADMAKENGKDVVFFTYWYGCQFNGEPSTKTLTKIDMEHMRERLIRPGTIYWKGRLHETPIPTNGAKHNYTTYTYDEKERPIAVMHCSKEVDLPLKMERNRHILELQLSEERAKGQPDPRTILYLMKIYTEMDDPEITKKIITMGEEYLAKSGWDEERATCLEHMAIASGKMGNDKDAIQYLHMAISEWVSQPLLYIRLAQAYFNVQNYRACEHWLNVASQMDLDNKGTNITNFKAMKVLFAELLLKLNYDVHRDTKKALEASRLLFSESPTEQNARNLEFIENVNDLNEACKETHKLLKYLMDIGESSSVIKTLDALPEAINAQPFAISIRRDISPPRKWQKNEICYFANFGTKFFEKWDESSLQTGIGGSETAIISLSQEWVKHGWKVTVYGDPATKGERNGINWLPYYYFNKKDFFNIFIQWRGWQLAGQVKCRKFFTDLHDIYAPVDFTNEDLNAIDKIMVKSQYHRSLAPAIADHKFIILSNGISQV